MVGSKNLGQSDESWFPSRARQGQGRATLAKKSLKTRLFLVYFAFYKLLLPKITSTQKLFFSPPLPHALNNEANWIAFNTRITFPSNSLSQLTKQTKAHIARRNHIHILTIKTPAKTPQYVDSKVPFLPSKSAYNIQSSCCYCLSSGQRLGIKKARWVHRRSRHKVHPIMHSKSSTAIAVAAAAIPAASTCSAATSTTGSEKAAIAILPAATATIVYLHHRSPGELVPCRQWFQRC